MSSAQHYLWTACGRISLYTPLPENQFKVTQKSTFQGVCSRRLQLASVTHLTIAVKLLLHSWCKLHPICSQIAGVTSDHTTGREWETCSKTTIDIGLPGILYIHVTHTPDYDITMEEGSIPNPVDNYLTPIPTAMSA